MPQKKNTLAGLLGASKDVAREVGLRRNEGVHLFKDGRAFQGLAARYEAYTEGDRDIPALDQMKRITTVPERLRYEAGFFRDLLRLLVTREKTNTIAMSDITLPDGTVVADVPVGVLMELPKQLREWRQELAMLPTLDNTRSWKPSPGVDHVFEAAPEDTVRQVKKLNHKVVVQPTKEHPAHVESYHEVVPAGKTIRIHSSGAITSVHKAQILRKLDAILIELERARAGANSTTPDRSLNTLGDQILANVLGDIMDLPDETDIVTP